MDGESRETSPQTGEGLTHFEICRFIRDTCLKLGALPKVTASALLIYHAVYKCDEMASFDEIDPYTVAAGCVWLATKESDDLVRLRDLVNVVYSTLNGTATPLALNDDFYDLRDTVGVVELLILRILNFRVPRPTFFNYLIHYLYSMEKWFHGRLSEKNETDVTLFQAVSRTAVSVCLDGLHRNTYLNFDDSAVALACLDLAIKIHGANVPLDMHSKRSWRKAICANLDWSVIKTIQEDLAKVYELDEPDWSPRLPRVKT